MHSNIAEDILVSVLRRVTEVLTPPPFRKSRTPLPVSPAPSYADLTQDYTARLRQLLKELVTTSASEAQARVDLAAQIRSLGGEKGLYATAGAIRVQLDAMGFRPTEGVTYCPAEGYRLAAELLLQQVINEIDAIRSSSSPLGPNEPTPRGEHICGRSKTCPPKNAHKKCLQKNAYLNCLSTNAYQKMSTKKCIPKNAFPKMPTKKCPQKNAYKKMPT